MRRRKLFTLAAGASAALCAAVCVLWVRSYRSPIGIGHTDAHSPLGQWRSDALGVNDGVFIQSSDVPDDYVPIPKPAQWFVIGAGSPGGVLRETSPDAMDFLGFS